MSITYKDYIHPDDESWQEQLRTMPVLAQALSRIYKASLVRMYRMDYVANSIRIGPSQLRRLHEPVVEACRILNLPVPEVYLKNSPDMNAGSLAGVDGEWSFIEINYGLVESFDEDELLAVIGHELGHIACGHSMYKLLLSHILQLGLSQLPLGKVALQGVHFAFYHWLRARELSCDRAAAIVCRGPDLVVETMIRLAGGSREISDQYNLEAFLEQGKDFEEAAESPIDRLLQAWMMQGIDHPFPVIRAQEIRRWCEGTDYQRALAKTATVGEGPFCSTCGGAIKPAWKFCGQCGAPSELQSAVIQKSGQPTQGSNTIG